MYIVKNNKIYPTLEYVRVVTGEDMIVNLGNEEKAKAEVRQKAEYILEELVRRNTPDNFNTLEGLIVNDEAYRNEFLRVVCRYIYDDFNYDKPREEIVDGLINGSQLLRLSRIRLWGYYVIIKKV